MFQSMNYIYEIYKTGSFSKAAKNLSDAARPQHRRKKGREGIGAADF